MIYLIATIVLLGMLIFAHELGHFIIAKLSGVKVERFALGFGPKIVGFKHGETEYLLAAIPFGGYVKMYGERGEMENLGIEEIEVPASPEDKARSFEAQSLPRRAAIILAGPIFNILFAVLVFAGLYMVGFPERLSVVGGIVANTPAASAGLEPGDRIVSIGGTPVATWEEMTALIMPSAGRELELKVLRGETEMGFRITPEAQEDENYFGELSTRGKIGVYPSGEFKDISYPLHRAIMKGADKTYETVVLTVKIVGMLFKGAVPSKEIGGPILIGYMAGQAAEQGIDTFFILAAIISVNLGVLNLLPVPVLDGGHLVFMGIEAVRGKPLSDRLMERAMKVGMALLLALMVFATYNDIIKAVTGKWLP